HSRSPPFPYTPLFRSFTVTPAGLAGSLLVLVAAALCVRLGFWQLDRREQRASHNARLEARLTQPILTLDSPIHDTTGMTYRRVQDRKSTRLNSSHVKI